MNKLDILEQFGAEFVSKLAPWLTPLLSAIVIAEAMMRPPFNWILELAILTGAIVEVNGVALSNTALTLYNWNRDNVKAINHRDEKRRAGAANLSLALASLIVYFATTLLLAVVLKIWPGLATAAYGLFVLLALASAANLALRADHHRRVAEYRAKMAAIEDAKRTKRSANQGATNHAGIAQNGANAQNFGPPLRTKKAGWRTQAAAIYAHEPAISGAELGRKIGASPRTGQNILRELSNGNGREATG